MTKHHLQADCQEPGSAPEQADCQEPGSAPEPYARQSSMGYFDVV